MRRAAFCLALFASPALAQAPPAAMPPAQPPAKGPALAKALEAAELAAASCSAHGYKVTVLVVDSAGVAKVLLAGDDAPSRTLQIAARKANTALAFKVRTSVVADRVKQDKDLADKIAADPALITWPGGQPLLSKGEVIGAMAVSGAPGGDKDDACIDAALAKVSF